MEIWVDADACPAQVKDILFRAAQRTQSRVTLVANAFLRTPPSPHIRALQVPSGPDAADRRIAEGVQPGDLVITADIPLASDVLARGGAALDPRGGWFTNDTIRERLAMRSMLDELRGAGVATGGPAPFSARDGRAFAAQLDGFLARAKRSIQPG
ncbi:YaiI/YqxD family protein [Chitinasiproducens palmae]|uniref:UPF0178 protein SAMN05216551_10910 n=1 Tax=Chitinasiproducens palmae TaxID=1770053 RepID=A0A1H2PRW7_9BURK|nr:YaiI/YqxD family protein [Chitinasiproducens palmae]SDV49637.1 hypothetical protein SAMN05216551_10910 [Chitinasiproducens palmae]